MVRPARGILAWFMRAGEWEIRDGDDDGVDSKGRGRAEQKLRGDSREKIGTELADEAKPGSKHQKVGQGRCIDEESHKAWVSRHSVLAAYRYRYELEYLALVLTPPGQGLPGLRLLPAPSVFAAPGGTRQRSGAYMYSGLGSRYNGAPFSVRAATSLAALAGFVGGRKVQWPLCWVRVNATRPRLPAPVGPARRAN
ncbi:hypothetical protein CFAM422_009473 [Trichoderma lentiforme]|uniref:Uncharacterized protein n=1 Tax=Trichoderma lentiforme TaxID=1567552 RepID=A0A9P4XB62_9HYPO|nr:hypothetical protein CFAM422_009473 [Trichoderma lentiforme]